MALYPGALIPWIEQRFFDADGNPLVGGKVYTYVAGTSSPQATYTDVDLTEAHTNPIILDAEGRPASPIYLAPNGYKFGVFDADDVFQYEEDNIEDVGQVFASTFGLVMTEGGKDVVSGYICEVDDRLVTVDSTGGANPCVITLLPAADVTQPLTIKNLGAIDVEITPNGLDTIDGIAAAFDLPAGTSPIFPTVTIMSDGVSSWYVTSSHGL